MSCSADGLTGLASQPPTARPSRSRRPIDERMTTGIVAARRHCAGRAIALRELEAVHARA